MVVVSISGRHDLSRGRAKSRGGLSLVVGCLAKSKYRACWEAKVSIPDVSIKIGNRTN